VYAAAFAVDARLVFGDRPKETTYRRLLSCPTLAELDETFGNQSERNYRLLLPEDHPLAAVPPMPAHDKFEQICIHERDEILTHTIRLEASNAEGAGEVVAVLGADHVPGVEKRWRSFVDGSATPPTPDEIDALNTAPDTAEDDIGVRLAIMQRLLGLRCTESLVNDANAALDADLDALKGEDIIAFNATSEIYGAARMLLACVNDRDVFDAVIGGRGGCDFGDVLSPMRDVRPMNGGKGWSEEALLWLRTASGVDFSALAAEER
jgi:hypothetical protein